MFANSRLNFLLKNEQIPPCRCKILDKELSVYIIGGPAYPLMPHLMKKYAGGCQEQYFGYELCSARNVIECSFGRLKARFGCLRRAMDINMGDLPNVIYACFVLHNFCEMNGETIGENNVRSTIAYGRDFQPATATYRYATDSNETEGKECVDC